MTNEQAKFRRHCQTLEKGIASSYIYVGLVTESFLKAPECALQMGYAILHEKYILLFIQKEVVVPAKLLRLADRTVEVDFESDDSQGLMTSEIRKAVAEQQLRDPGTKVQ